MNTWMTGFFETEILGRIEKLRCDAVAARPKWYERMTEYRQANPKAPMLQLRIRQGKYSVSFEWQCVFPRRVQEGGFIMGRKPLARGNNWQMPRSAFPTVSDSYWAVIEAIEGWPAAGSVDTELRLFHRIGGRYGTQDI